MGAFIMDAVNDNENCRLIGYSNTKLTWNGYNVLTDGSSSFRLRNTFYNVGDIAYCSNLPAGYYLECIIAGTTSMYQYLTINNPTIGDTVSDGTAVWTVKGINNLLYDNNENVIQTNLNDIIKEGIYTIGINNNNINAPSSYQGKLIVFNRGSRKRDAQDNLIWVDYKYQIYITLVNGVQPLFYCRAYNESTWTNWQQQESIVAKSLGASGYIKYASGLILQWGYALAGSTVTVTLPINMPSKSYIVVTTPDNAVNTCNAAISTLTNTDFVINSNTTYAGNRWIAIGY